MTPTTPQKPLRVLMISDFPHRGVVVGGVQSAVQILATALSSSPGIEEILLMNLRTDIRTDDVVRVNDKLTVHHIAGQRRFSLATGSFFDYLKGKNIVEKFAPDVVHGQGTGDHGDIATRLGVPSVITIHGVGTFEAELRERKNAVIGPIRIWLTRKLVRRVVERANVLISISGFDREYSASIRDSHVVGVPNAVRSDFFAIEPAFPAEPRICFAGLLTERKNVVGIVRSFHQVKKHVPNAVLDIAGPIADQSYYKEILGAIHPDIKNDVVFHNNLKGPELAKLMSRSAVSVLFSVYENLPVVIAEALALGKPVVSSNVGAVSEMVQDGVNGFLVPSEDETALAEKLIVLLNNPQLRKTMGTKGRERALAKWTPEYVADETLKAYRRALE